MNKFLVFILALTFTNVALANDKIKSMREAQKVIFSCNENIKDAPFKLRTETIITEVVFDGFRTGGATKLTIMLEYEGKKAISVVQKQVPKTATYQNYQQYFIDTTGYKDDFKGVEYEAISGPLKDAKGRKYPGEMLVLKAAIPESQRTGDDYEMSHLSINVILPESRAQYGREFEASGYIDYSSTTKGKRLDGLTIGLGLLFCTEKIIDY